MKEANYGITDEGLQGSANKGFVLLDGGRIKMSGASPNKYFDLVDQDPLVTHRAFLDLRHDPPMDLLMAFFPDSRAEIKQRLRGPGLYRHLRMDQGPGGNFGPFKLGAEGKDSHVIAEESGYVVVEELVRQQLDAAPKVIGEQIDQIRRLFAQNLYGQTAREVEAFVALCGANNIRLPEGDVGSRNGLFFIRPVAFEHPVEIGGELYAKVADAVENVLKPVLAKAYLVRQLVQSGESFSQALDKAKHHIPAEANTYFAAHPPVLFFQPDCLISSDGEVQVEKIRLPDVSLFLMALESYGNDCFSAVREVNLSLREQLKSVLGKALHDKPITIVTRDEVVTRAADTLENLECRELQKMLSGLGLRADVVSLTETIRRGVSNEHQVLLMNLNPETPAYAALASQLIERSVDCYPDPCLKALEPEASGFHRMVIDDTQKHLSRVLALAKPKSFTDTSARQVHQQLETLFTRGGFESQVLSVRIPGLSQPLPVFRPSLHSVSQIYNAVDRVKRSGGTVEHIEVSEVPFDPEKAFVRGPDGPRISAVRFFGVTNVF